MGDKGVGRRHRRDSRGAAAVEFALVVPLLFGLLFGIIEYGMWFNESLNLRQGVREAARQGVVQRASSNCASGTAVANIACMVDDQADAYAGHDVYTRVVVPAGGWKRGESLLVCGMVQTTGITNLFPMPNGGVIESKTRMSIEVETPTVPAGTTTSGTPSGADWGFCA